MFARVSRYHGAPGKVREGSRVMDEITPEIQQMPGFQRAYLFVDGKSGEAISMSLWGSEDEANRSTAPVGPMRERIARALGASGSPTVEVFEVATEIGSQTEGGRFARVSEYGGSPDKIENGIRTVKSTESNLMRMQGFRRAFLFADRKTGRAMTMTFWDSEVALNQSASGINPIRDEIGRGFGASEKPTVEVFEVAGEVPQRARRAA